MLGMEPDPVGEAMVEAHRRAAISDLDVSGPLTHFVATARSLCADWGLTATGWFSEGAGMPTLAVTQANGDGGVLKLAPAGALDVQARVMTAAHGRGYAVVLAWDAARGAILTERLGDSLAQHTPEVAAQGEAVVGALRRAWEVPLRDGSPFEGKALGLSSMLANLGERYGSRHPDALALAARYTAELARSERPEVVCHGDPHPGNVLRRGEAWALIDPDGFVGEREYDLGVTLRDACWQIIAAEAQAPGSSRVWLRARCHRVAQLAGADADRIWAWAFVERVTTGLSLHWLGHTDKAKSFLNTADLLTRSTTNQRREI